MKINKSYVCEKLGRTLNFLPDRVSFCCSYAEGPGLKYEKGMTLNLKEITKSEMQFIKLLKNGKIPAQCSGCIDYKEKKYNNFFEFLFSKQSSMLINEIIVNHFKQCDCNCVYCSQKIIWGDETQQNYELLPIIKELFKADSIDKNNLKVEFQGGNVSVLSEFEPLMQEFLNNGCKYFTILTNGIKYLSVIEKTNSMSGIIFRLIISLDSGTKETFAKIKQIDAFDEVIKNIKEYGIKTGAIITLKYILIKDINDNSREVENFLNLAKELRCIHSLCFDIDYRDILFDKSKNFKVLVHYGDLIEQARKFCMENRINFVLLPYAEQYIENNKKV